MSSKEVYQLRYLQGLTVEPTIEEVVEAYQSIQPPNRMAAALFDPYDFYLWTALAESEKAMIRLIESMRQVQVAP